MAKPQTSFRVQRRRELGYSQRGLGDELEVPKNTVSSWEQDLREPSDELALKLDRVLALGERGDGEDDPLYLIAAVGSDGRPIPYLDRQRRPCALPGRPLAHQIVAFLRQGGEEQAAAVPVWESHVRALLIANADDGDDPEDIVARSVGLDTRLDLAAYHARLLRWATEVVEKLSEPEEEQ